MDRSKEKFNWALTEGGGLFTNPESNYSADRTLGMTLEVVETWKEKRYRVLEIGPGATLKTFLPLLSHGVDAVAIEPTLQINPYLWDRYVKHALMFIEKRPQNSYLNPDTLFFSERIQNLFAEDAYKHPMLQQKKADIAFAQGINFQAYAQTPQQYIRSLYGILNALTEEGVLMYEIQNTIQFTCFQCEPRYGLFNTLDFLTSLNAPLEIKFTDAGYRYIHIFNGSWREKLLDTRQ